MVDARLDLVADTQIQAHIDRYFASAGNASFQNTTEVPLETETERAARML